MHDLIEGAAQFVIATHSPIIMAYPEATIYEFSAGGIREVAYRDSEHFRVTRAFLTRTEQVLKELFKKRSRAFHGGWHAFTAQRGRHASGSTATCLPRCAAKACHPPTFSSSHNRLGHMWAGAAAIGRGRRCPRPDTGPRWA